MELLKQRIREEGIVLNNRVLKVDGFLIIKSIHNYLNLLVKKLLTAIVMQGYNVLLLLRHLALHWH